MKVRVIGARINERTTKKVPLGPPVRQARDGVYVDYPIPMELRAIPTRLGLDNRTLIMRLFNEEGFLVEKKSERVEKLVLNAKTKKSEIKEVPTVKYILKDADGKIVDKTGKTFSQRYSRFQRWAQGYIKESPAMIEELENLRRLEKSAPKELKAIAESSQPQFILSLMKDLNCGANWTSEDGEVHSRPAWDRFVELIKEKASPTGSLKNLSAAHLFRWTINGHKTSSETLLELKKCSELARKELRAR